MQVSYAAHLFMKTISFDCACCGKSVTTNKVSRVLSGRTKYCSRQCQFSSMRGQVETTCDYCQNPLWVRPSDLTARNYCDVRCKGLKQTADGWRTKECLFCGEEFKCYKSTEEDRKFCSIKCYKEYTIKKWEHCVSDAVMRRLLIKQRGEMCQNCGWA